MNEPDETTQGASLARLDKFRVAPGRPVLPSPTSPERTMLKKVAFTMYPVRDTARARAFYEGVLGLVPGTTSTSGVWTEYDLPGGGCFALFRTDDIGPGLSAGGTIAFEVDDLDAMVARLTEQGVTFKGPMVHSPVCRMSIIVDPEGNTLILHELKPR